jgi:hypothetical protein
MATNYNLKKYHSHGPTMTMDKATMSPGEPTNKPLASFPPDVVSLRDDDGRLHIYKAEDVPTVDRRPSKLRAAMAKITPKSGDNQTNNIIERGIARAGLAEINQRNRNRFDQEHPWGKKE